MPPKIQIHFSQCTKGVGELYFGGLIISLAAPTILAKN